MRLRPALLIVGVLAAAAAAPALACINEYGTTRQGDKVDLTYLSADDLEEALEERYDREENVDWATEVTRSARISPTPENLNDLGVVLIRFGRIPEAILLLERIERRWPGRAAVASNLGTAFELAGDNRKALHWIREGMRRNPDDHWGTEWLHARILEAKIDPSRLPRDGSSVLRLDFGDATMRARPTRMPARNDGESTSMYELGAALRYQVVERAGFLGPPEPILAGLLFDWANLELQAGTLEAAIVLYDAAEDYGNPQEDLIDRRRAEARRLLELAEKHPHSGGTCELCEPPPRSPEKGASSP